MRCDGRAPTCHRKCLPLLFFSGVYVSRLFIVCGVSVSRTRLACGVYVSRLRFAFESTVPIALGITLDGSARAPGALSTRSSIRHFVDFYRTAK